MQTQHSNIKTLASKNLNWKTWNISCLKLRSENLLKKQKK